MKKCRRLIILIHPAAGEIFHKHTGVFHLTPAQQDNFMKLYYYFKQECAKRQHAYKHAVELAVINYLLSLTRDLGNSHGEEPQVPTDGKIQACL